MKCSVEFYLFFSEETHEMTKTVSKSPELEHFSLCEYSENIVIPIQVFLEKKVRIYF